MIGQAFEENRMEVGRSSFSREMDYVKPERGPYAGDLVKGNSISAELVDLRDLVSQAHELLTALDDRTRMFRQPVPQMKVDQNKSPNVGSEVRANLMDQNDRLRQLNNRISTMIEEIDF